ncbi:MFS transporter [Streptomyces sp. NBC_00009]|uniref:MFS transporter n=1 Tax=Streptomyces sp. NBC_00009 TaxID=2975620 RepID=UPI00325212E9
MVTHGVQNRESAGPAAASDAPPLRGAQVVGLVATLLLGVISFQLNASMVTPALPDMAERLGGSVDDIAQVSSLFFLAGAIGGVILSRISDFVGRRKVLVAVLTVTAVGTLICFLAPSLPVLLIGRVLQGASSAAFQIAYVILNERLSAKVFGTALGVLTAINGGVGGVDGFFGGALSDRYGFRAIFAVILVVGVLAAVCVALFIPKDRPSVTAGRMDWWGAGALSVALYCVTYFVSHGSSDGWTSPSTLGYLAGTLVSALAFGLVERGRATPLVSLTHLKSRRMWPLVTTTVLVLSGVFAVINFTVVIISQNPDTGFGLSATDSALLFLTPAALIGLGAAPMAGWFAGKRGWLTTLRAGLVLSIVALCVVAAFPLDKWLVIAAVAFLGITYNGLVLTTLNGLGVLLSPKDAPAALPGLNGAAFGIGAGLGIGIVAPYAARATAGGYATALWISVAITVLALGTSLFIAAPRTDHA